jgi:hypothetical protein
MTYHLGKLPLVFYILLFFGGNEGRTPVCAGTGDDIVEAARETGSPGVWIVAAVVMAG